MQDQDKMQDDTARSISILGNTSLKPIEIQTLCLYFNEIEIVTLGTPIFDSIYAIAPLSY